MKKILNLILISSILISINISAQSSKLLLPEQNNSFVKKNIQIDDINHYYYIYRKEKLAGRRDLVVLFHGGRNNAIEFLNNSALYQDIIQSNNDLLVFQSIDDNNWYKSKDVNEKFVKLILNFYSQQNIYKNIKLIGYVEGGTFSYDLICNGSIKSEDIHSVFLVNSTINKKCEINKKIKHNLIYGSEMKINAIDNNYFSNFDEINDFFYKNINCKKSSDFIYNGASYDPIYMLKFNLNCEVPEALSIYKVEGMGRNMPMTNHHVLPDFEGNHLKSFVFYKLLE